jgi:hypothetical protein
MTNTSWKPLAVDLTGVPNMEKLSSVLSEQKIGRKNSSLNSIVEDIASSE